MAAHTFCEAYTAHRRIAAVLSRRKCGKKIMFSICAMVETSRLIFCGMHDAPRS